MKNAELIALDFKKIESGVVDLKDYRENVDRLIKAYEPAIKSDDFDLAQEAFGELNAGYKKLEKARKAFKKSVIALPNELAKENKKIDSLLDIHRKVKAERLENEHLEILSIVRREVEEALTENGLYVGINDIDLNKYALKGNLTARKKLNTKTKQAIADDIMRLHEAKEARREAYLAIGELCAANNLGQAPYIRQYDDGYSLSEVTANIKSDVEKAKAQKKEAGAPKFKATQSQSQPENSTKYELKGASFVFPSLKVAREFRAWLETNGVEFDTPNKMTKVKE